MAQSSSDGQLPRLGVPFGPMNLAIIKLSRAHMALAAQLMREVGLSPEQGRLLMFLWASGPVRQHELAIEFSKDSAATTRTVHRLEQGGYVARRRDPLDGRATLVEPTAAGNALRPRIEALWRELEEWTLQQLSPTARNDAVIMMHSMLEGVHAHLDPARGDDLDVSPA